MRVVRLYGTLAVEYGREYRLDVASPAEAVQALCRILNGFKQRLANSTYGVHVRVGRGFRGAEDVCNPCSFAEEIRIIPATAGSNSTVRIIAGAVITAVGAYFQQYWAMGFGLSLMAGGIAEKLAPKPKTSDYASNQAGYTFSSGVNTTGEGVGMPIVIGHTMVGSHVLSARVVSDVGTLDYTDGGVVDGDSLNINSSSPTDSNGISGGSSGDTASNDSFGGDDTSGANSGDSSDD